MKKTKKGFTLTEMIIVLAIIGILSAILVPSWMTYIHKSRLKSQNANAKVIFNAAQTIMVDYELRERTSTDASADKVENGDFYLEWDGASGTSKAYTDSTDKGSTLKSSTLAAQINEKIGRIFDGQNETMYVIYIKDYKVVSVVSARSETDRYKGTYPVRATELSKINTTDTDMNAIAL